MDSVRIITWPGWETVGVIGRGSFGTVYEIRRDILGDIERAALKHISIPSSEDEIENLMSEGLDAESITRTFREQLNDIVEEYKLMRKLDDCPYVVRCDDVQYVEKENRLGWDIFIKMELLTPVTKILSAQSETPEEDIVRLAKDMSRALVRCEELHILHRDIKIQNIFKSEDGKYKLGDFGIAKAKERTSTGTARIGTYDYMAPEVYFGKRYDHTADIYSLGMVLYWLLNGRRMPFLPQMNAAPRMQEREAARMRRLNGAQLPPPVNGSKELKRIVLKCCAYRPEDRYTDANALLGDLYAMQRPSAPKKERKRIREPRPTTASPAREPLPKLAPELRRVLQPEEARAFKAKRRRRRVASAVSVVLLAAIVLVGGQVFKHFKRNTARGNNASTENAITTEHPSPSPTDNYWTSISLYESGIRYLDSGQYSEAISKFKESAEYGHVSAMTAVGLMYQYGLGVEQDSDKAREWYAKAAVARDGLAESLLQTYDEEQLLSRTNREVVSAASKSLNDMGMMRYNEGNYDEAMNSFQKAASTGNANAMNNIGDLYYYGLGVERDYTLAMEWYWKGADAGNASAMDNIGWMYGNGLGVEQDYAQAMEWYRKAADAGNAAAMYNIGWMYQNGLGVEQDYALAMEWYRKAAVAGEAAGMNNIGWLYQNGLGVEQDYALAMEWYRKAAEAGNESAMYNIGEMYEYGYGVTQNSVTAQDWYQKAADAGLDEAKTKLGQ